MSGDQVSIWEQARMQGYSRRDFLQFCSWIAATAGIHSTGLAQVVKALDAKPRPPVVWLHFEECTCCSESFIRSSHPIVADVILDKISLDYTETLQAAAGKQAEAALHDTMTKHKGEYLMLVEGAVPTADDGIYCCIAGRTGQLAVFDSRRAGSPCYHCLFPEHTDEPEVRCAEARRVFAAGRRHRGDAGNGGLEMPGPGEGTSGGKTAAVGRPAR